MSSAPVDVAQVRLDNAMLLFEEFVAASVKHPDPATLRGLERRFAERLQIQPSYWSQIKSRSRQIGERLARQFEQLFHKPPYWMDQPHGADPSGKGAELAAAADSNPSVPQDDDERFIVGLVLTYYRRHPQRARTRLLDLLGEVLTPPTAAATAPPAPSSASTAAKTGKAENPVKIGAVARPGPAPAPKAAPGGAAELDEWRRLQQGIAPLKPKKR
ncbi:hypothetical protein DBR47_23120 [Paucibacter sp. KBW04]|uniref:hypothetical protein n=1 Tax=Paucibacter sp. KBW04 TaxID=2153361 RepID=UPI000F582F1E|nr:hypothetical protein [Paucibacter sp. KBW04]RQO53620.1 hypothetical protein DBR47_23120 [Paucibacter sp. KBW04]